jgi:hypothetical protein
MSLSDYTGSNLVFIVGCPRSGTTYLQKLLASHPQVHSGWESYVFAWYLGPLLRNWDLKEHYNAPSGERRRIGLHTYLGEQEFQELLKEFIRAMMKNVPKGDIFLEKTPRHSLWIPEIVRLLPDAKFINIIRDCRDVVASLLAASKTWGEDVLTRHTFSATKLWTKYVRAVEKSRELVPKENFIEIRYEELRRDPANKLALLSQFLNLNWNDSDLREAVEKNDIKQAITTGGTQLVATQAESANASSSSGFKYSEVSFIRKGKPGSWKEDLRFYQKWQIWLLARSTMESVGYPWKYPW